MKASLLALRSPAFSTSSRMRETVDSSLGFVTWMRRRPVWLTQPLRISSPGFTSRGTDSPVRAAVSREELPSVTVPSRGTRWPGFTTMVSPTATSSTSTSSVSPSRSTKAVSGRRSISWEMEVRERFTATSWKSSPVW